MLQYFVNIIHWRIPTNTRKVREYIKNAKDVSAFRMKLVDTRTNKRCSEEEELELLAKGDGEFYKFVKLMLPAITYPEIFTKDFQNNAHIFPFHPGLPKLVSDNPIIYRNPGEQSLHVDDFIFPITPTQVLFRHRFKKLKIYSEIRQMIDCLLLMQANEYVSCTDLQYPLFADGCLQAIVYFH